MARELRREFEVVVAAGPDEAIELLKSEQNFAAVLSDFSMEPIDGVELLGAVRERKPGCARILVSGAVHEDNFDDRLHTGILHRVIAKPWPPGKLAEIVRTVIDSLAHHEA